MNRRSFIRNCAMGASMLASSAIVECATAGPKRRAGAARRVMPLNNDWLFGGKFTAGSENPNFNDATFSRVMLPHCIANLSWQNWNQASWEDVWIYRRHFPLPKEFLHRRVFLGFERVMVGAAPVINGHTLPPHVGGYLPFQYEITQWVREGDNVLAVAVDSRWQNVTPEGSPKGPTSIDFLEPGGLTGSVTLRTVPQVFISDVFAKPFHVLDPRRSLEITCSLDAAAPLDRPVEIRVDLMEKGKPIASAAKTLQLEQTGETEVRLTLSRLGNVKLWDVAAPHLYEIVTTLLVDREPLHDYRVRIGLREARFETEGFYLNGRRLQLFGLNRHELFPYVGFAMPARVMRHDAELLRHELNCNIVRCSHYPQSEAFFDACDELGLMAWEELPGWHYMGDEAWQKLAIRDVRDMVRRDRNHPSIVIWGARINESANNPDFYKLTTAAAKALDDSRAVSGAMDGSHYSMKDWSEDVFAYNDYAKNPSDGSVKLRPPLAGAPYLLTEAVGQIIGSGPSATHKYRRAGDPALQARQAIFHAEAHDQAAKDKAYLGVIAWCALDYGSLMNSYNNVKCPGVADSFRIPKLGASFYQSQVSPAVRPVIEPNFYWDFGPQTPNGPGRNAAIFSNCERLEVFVKGRQFAAVKPDRDRFPHLAYPPFFCDLEIGGGKASELRIDGYVGDRLLLSRSFSADAAQDQFILKADDAELIADGSDATRLAFMVVDKFGARRAFATGEVALSLAGPGVIVGDNPFGLAESGGGGAVWIRSLPGEAGRVTVKAVHSTLGTKSTDIDVKPDVG